MPAPLLHSPLDARHRTLGASMTAFGGWEMPISYAGSGVVAEHTAVRTAVGVFDVSHLGKVLVSGPGAAAFLNRCLTADLDRIGPGQAQYTLCCTPSGGVLDDLIAYRVSDDEVFLVPNAANSASVAAVLAAAAPSPVQVIDQHRDFGVLAVQGPAAATTLERLGLPTDLPYLAFVDAPWTGGTVRICRTGYTGEHGYELLPAWDDAPALFDAVLAAAAESGGRAAGLGARDTLRTEMGYALHGQDLGPTISPVQARIGWAVGWTKPEFFGRDALLAERERGPGRTARGLVATGRGVLRADLDVLDADGAVIGRTTSGTFSPTLGKGIALALIDTATGIADGAEVQVDVRGRRIPAQLGRPPFVPSHVR
ncbi:glycine cleavage system aminomethyltransferase GcvT [Nakamurella sp. YIM 132084]|uniref:aminomethyltransferase n=1 Tax=Nakamurella leprariae TaxID=2803911 RepID=A0A938Y6V8_9ACTN|nr:glycine cleavage system aminomethyltransferase GcvT [Nakamurella leprariae]